MANLVTILRFLLIPVFAVLLLTSNNLAATVVFLLMAFTDWLDGFIARRTKITKFGKIADPIADRLVVIVATVLLTFKGLMPLPVMAILMSREFIVAISVFILQMNGITMEVIVLGKYATTAVFISIVLILLQIPYSQYFIYLAALFYLIVGGIYVYKTIYFLRRKRS